MPRMTCTVAILSGVLDLLTLNADTAHKNHPACLSTLQPYLWAEAENLAPLGCLKAGDKGRGE